MLETAVTTALAGLVALVAALIPRCVAQPPPGYDSSVHPDSLITTSGSTYLPTSYTLTNPACTGTSASCPCAGGYMCLTIADCHWKCLMTTLPPMPSPTPTIPASNSASGPSITAVPITSVPQTSSGQGGTSQGGGSSEGGSSRTGGHQTETAAPEQTTITVTQYPSTCRRQTGTTTLFTAETITSCPATCPSG